MKEKRLYFFTFGSGQLNEGKCQPIYAESFIKARERMFEVYGDKWGFQYEENEWKKIREMGIAEKEMKPLYQHE